MAEYIEREAALRAVHGQRGPCRSPAQNRMLDYLKASIVRIPAADVAPVVRCKGCKHKGWVQEPCHGKSVDYCKVWDCTLRNLETTFCSYGERKENNDA